jgi:predicted nucleic acid-binding protein
VGNRIALDSGAVIKLADGDEYTRAVLRKWTDQGYETIIPAPVLAEVLRGGARDAKINRILNSRAYAVTIAPLTESAATDAGRRLGSAKMQPSNVIDALIVATAIEADADYILTCDPDDITPLAGSELVVLPI